MKNILMITLVIMTSINSVFGQTEIIGVFNAVHIGRNTNIELSQSFDAHSVSIGIKWHHASIVHDNENNLFFKRFYPKTFMEHVGFTLGYQYRFVLPETSFSPFIFYNFQFSNASIRNQAYIPFGKDENGDMLYYIDVQYLGPAIALENYGGFGFSFKLLGNFYAYQRFGAGMASFFNVPDGLIGESNNNELAFMLSVGLKYQISP